jgi:hypothetical protein
MLLNCSRTIFLNQCTTTFPMHCISNNNLQNVYVKGKGKGKDIPVTGRVGP